MMLEATEKAAGRRLFAARIYEEDAAVLKAKIASYSLLKQSLLTQCTK
jgi:hypothetical protein